MLKTKPDGSKYRILHISGSSVSTYYLHLAKNFAKDAFNGADREKFDHILVFIRPATSEEDGPQWVFYDGITEFTEELFRDSMVAGPFMSQMKAIEKIQSMDIDAIQPHLFCYDGGVYYRNLFDLINIPYIGSSGAMYHINYDKWMTRCLAQGHNVRLPKGQLL